MEKNKQYLLSFVIDGFSYCSGSLSIVQPLVYGRVVGSPKPKREEDSKASPVEIQVYLRRLGTLSVYQSCIEVSQ